MERWYGEGGGGMGWGGGGRKDAIDTIKYEW
jgi:hypothetical protein